MTKKAALAFLGMSLIGWIGWIVTRFWHPILGVSHEGFLIMTLLSLAFVTAFSLIELVFEMRKRS